MTSPNPTRPALKPVPTDRVVDLSMRARQLASTVRQGRKVMFFILDEDPIDGYLAGWDADTYLVVYPYGGEVMVELIPKRNLLKMLLGREGTFREEPLYEEMNQIVRQFRDMINATYFEKKV